MGGPRSTGGQSVKLWGVILPPHPTWHPGAFPLLTHLRQATGIAWVSGVAEDPIAQLVPAILLTVRGSIKALG